MQEETNGKTAQGSHKTGRLAKAHAGFRKAGRSESRRKAQKEARKKNVVLVHKSILIDLDKSVFRFWRRGFIRSCVSNISEKEKDKADRHWAYKLFGPSGYSRNAKNQGSVDGVKAGARLSDHQANRASRGWKRTTGDQIANTRRRSAGRDESHR